MGGSWGGLGGSRGVLEASWRGLGRSCRRLSCSEEGFKMLLKQRCKILQIHYKTYAFCRSGRSKLGPSWVLEASSELVGGTLKASGRHLIAIFIVNVPWRVWEAILEGSEIRKTHGN